MKIIPTWASASLPKVHQTVYRIALAIFIIYIYIVIHKQIVSLYQNSSVWLDTRDDSSWDRNPADFYVIRISYPKPIVILSLSKGTFYVYIFTYTLSASGVLNSWEERERERERERGGWMLSRLRIDSVKLGVVTFHSALLLPILILKIYCDIALLTFSCIEHCKLIDWLIDFNGILTHLWLFYANRLRNCVRLYLSFLYCFF